MSANHRFVLDIAAMVAADELRAARALGLTMVEAFKLAYIVLDDVIEIGAA